ncbi:MAG: TldD/PmbA family protein [Candidatus Thorarchaeota archaeon]|jgi:TldD protein
MESLAKLAIETGLDLGMSFVDVRIETSRMTRLEVVKGVTMKTLIANHTGGGIRAFTKGSWAFGHTSDLTVSGIRKAVESLSRMVSATAKWVDKDFEIDAPTFTGKAKYRAKGPINNATIEEKIEVAQSIDHQLRQADSRVTHTRVRYRDVWTDRYVANSLQTETHQETGQITLIPTCTVKEYANIQKATIAYGLTGGLGDISKQALYNLGTKPAKIAVDLLDSVSLKGGVYDVIADPVLNGAMIHEAFGHACEAGNHTAGSSVLKGRLNSAIGPETISITDDPTREHHIGSYEYDSEGTPARKRELVRDGVLTAFLHDLDTAARLEMEPNGAARAASFMHPPIPRMSNTFMEPGDWELDELIQDTKDGVLMCDVNYGYADSSKGQFMFQAPYGYQIQDGERTKMVRNASIAGLITDILWKIDGVGNDFSYDVGTCGTQNQMVLVMSGGPHVRIRQVPVGGT